MKLNTKIMGEVEVDDAKIIRFPGGIVGFPEYQNFILVHDAEAEGEVAIRYLQSVDEGELALPVIDPTLIKEDYNPTVEDQYLESLGDITGDNMIVFVTIAVPPEIENMTINLKAPIVINVDTFRAAQVISDDDLPVRLPIYDILSERAKEKEDA